VGEHAADGAREDLIVVRSIYAKPSYLRGKSRSELDY
jgi:hypothetical protein